MRVLVASDKFKHSLNSFEAVNHISNGLKRASDSFQVLSLPLSDGGDHFSEVLAYYTNAQEHTTLVSDPLFRPIQANYYINGKTAFIEMAKASGLQLLKPEEYNCMETSTYGVGQLIRHAIQQSVDEIVLGIGGSATNDCGIGMAAALGYQFLDKDGKEIKPIGGNLVSIRRIDNSRRICLDHIRFVIASDVSNFLTGQHGAAKIYAPQKGASPEMVHFLEEGAIQFADIMRKDLGIETLHLKGGGAAGGLGAGGYAFLNAEIVNGADVVFNYSDTEKHIEEADLVITGEGKLDQQSMEGKLLYSIAALCRKYNKPLIAICGTLDITPQQVKEAGFTAALSIINKPMPPKEAFTNAATLLEETSFYVGRIIESL
jgi:glycerate 2-kinase